MTTASVTRRLAQFVQHLRLDDVPAPVVAQAQLLALDTLGSCLASSTMDFGRSVLDSAEALGGGAESSLVGRPTRVAAANAVLANGTLAHGLDFDDTREDAIVHTGCVAVTTALACGEAADAPGARALEALIAGVEVMCRIGLVVPGRFHARHFHPTSLTAGFAAAAAARKQAGHCGSQAGGIIEYLADGSWTKRLHPGWGAHAGVVAARLAAAGFTGPERVLEGEHGFYAAFAGGHDAPRLEAQMESLGRIWEILNLTYKPYPAGSIAHPYMDCAARLREKHAIEPETIAEIRCRTADGGSRSRPSTVPRTGTRPSSACRIFWPRCWCAARPAWPTSPTTPSATNGSSRSPVESATSWIPRSTTRGSSSATCGSASPTAASSRSARTIRGVAPTFPWPLVISK